MPANMVGPRILTFNFHEPYLCLMAKTGLQFAVGQYASGGLVRAWQSQFRSLPPNMTLVEEPVWRQDLRDGKYDVVIAHNESNAADLLGCQTPALLVCHNRRSFLETTLPDDNGASLKGFSILLKRLQEEFEFVFISESKREDYNLPGSVILPGIDVSDYDGYRGEVREVLRVGNSMRARNRMFDVDFQEEVVRGLPNRVVGSDPEIPGATPSRSWEDLIETYRSLRCYLHVSREAWEDGYNLAMLEAMATGMPVVSLANRTSPIRDGIDGFVSSKAETLRKHLNELLVDPGSAKAIGAKGRERVMEKFPIDAFTSRWAEAIDEAAQQKRFSAGVPRASQRPGDAPPRKASILMEYMSDPITTARYLEEALRADHEVVTVGPRLPESVMSGWGFDGDIPEYPPQQIDHDGSADYPEVLRNFPPAFRPDLFLFVDSARQAIGGGIEALDCLRACYLIDTHMDAELRLGIARNFHCAFLAQKGQVEMFRQAGLPSVHWLPLACSPALHDIGERERIYDVAYVGGLMDPRRKDLLGRVAQRFPNNRIGRAWPHEMAEVYAQSKIVVNACINRDVNMRVFEAMASGALLITDEAEGLEDLFEDGKHLVIYRNDEQVFELIERYLDDDEARCRIAEAGQRLTLTEHTYAQRMRSLLAAALEMKNVRGEGGAQPGVYYRLARPELAREVPSGARRVLDVGCGTGELGRLLKNSGVAEVVGIELEESAWAEARLVLDDAFCGDVEKMDLPFADGYFDAVVCGDVLEHLVDPVSVLRKFARILSPEGIIIISMPNARYAQVVAMLAHGRWKYEDAGIMDRTHLRFFTKTDLIELVREAGLRLVKMAPLSLLPEDQLPLDANRTLRLGRMSFEGVGEAEYEEFRAYQYLVVAGRPELDLLAKAERAVEDGAYESAYELAEKALEVDERRRRRIMAVSAARLGLLDKAEEHYRAVLELDPADAQTKGDLGLLLIGMNRPVDARAVLDEALAASPDDFKITGALGLAYLGEQKEEEAFQYLQKAVALNFDSEEILNHLIKTAHILGRLSEVEEPVKRFVDFYPGNTAMSFSYATVLCELEKTAQAHEQLETLLLLSPGHEEALKLLAELDEKEETDGPAT